MNKVLLFKLITILACPYLSTGTFAQDSVEVIDTDATTVSLGDHFQASNDTSFLSNDHINHALKGTGATIGTLVFLSAYQRQMGNFSEYWFNSEKLKSYDFKTRALLRSEKVRFDRKVSFIKKAGYLGTSYFVLDLATGSVLAAKNYKPVFAENLPGVIQYLWRKKTHTPPTTKTPDERRDIETLIRKAQNSEQFSQQEISALESQLE